MAGQKDTGEERNIWPTQRRLNRLRRDGIVPVSRDFQMALAVLAVVIYMLVNGRAMLARLQTGILVVDPTMPGGFANEATRVAGALGRLLVEVVGPIFALAIFGALLGAVLDARGFPVKVKQLAPDFSHLSPSDGLKRIFSLRSLLEFIKGLIVVVLVIGANALLFRALYNDLMWAPGCGVDCAARMLTFVIGGSILIGVVVLLANAFADLPLSRWLFRRDNRMSVTENKREQRDDEGDPDVRRERRRLARQSLEASVHTGLHRAGLIIFSGEAAVAVSYVAGETTAPVLSARTRTEAAEFIRRAGEMGLPVAEDAAIVESLIDAGQVGAYIPRSTFVDVARLLIIHGIIRPGST